jgi:hypothetical protein
MLANNGTPAAGSHLFPPHLETGSFAPTHFSAAGIKQSRQLKILMLHILRALARRFLASYGQEDARQANNSSDSDFQTQTQTLV